MQIAFALQQAKTRPTSGEACRKMGIAQATPYRWKRVFSRVGLAKIRPLLQLQLKIAGLRTLFLT
ncbi:MAG: transposase [Paracoccaceae bacterium]